ncbi:SDR family oxidoreductase [Parvibaculum sp.]|jgi:NAD(P)-dependent dehydrogenase (short-subunit alcohol dehydrogenase family)|uniref:SDR family oxidoreductase n=1 Tax=Parvibaculum sp. TaxID=2024848 RepID=UPI001ACDA937|nr:SDR family oxidoreductase [Alphaproteobacteria bacterium]
MAGLCKGRVVIVTGGARGIGREHCLEFARQGAKVVVNDLGGERTGEGRSSEPAEALAKEIRAMGGEAVANGDDVSDWDGAKRMIDQAISTFGGLDVLVSNAGILRDRMLTNMTIDEWDAVIKVHLRGTFCPAHHAANYWRAQVKAGKTVDARIINTTSVSGLLGNQGQCNYGAAKAGIAAFTITSAMELARYGITVNAISPGALTRMTEDLGYAVAVPEGEWNPRDPANIAPIVVWLGSSESKDVTGQVFESTSGRLTVFERWQRGPAINPKRRFDPAELGPIVKDLLSKTRPPDAIGG